jgi:prepilin-type N-terminal cleavage/methylation domain-containing protein
MKRAFTLIELLMVMAIMGVMLTITITAFNSLGSGTGVRGALLQTRSELSLARQNAIARRVKTRLHIGNTEDSRGYIFRTEVLDPKNPNDETVFGSTNYLPKGFYFGATVAAPQLATPNQDDVFEFNFDGSADSEYPDRWTSDLSTRAKTKDIIIKENRPGGLVVTSVVYGMTGRIKHWSHK